MISEMLCHFELQEWVINLMREARGHKLLSLSLGFFGGGCFFLSPFFLQLLQVLKNMVLN